MFHGQEGAGCNPFLHLWWRTKKDPHRQCYIYMVVCAFEATLKVAASEEQSSAEAGSARGPTRSRGVLAPSTCLHVRVARTHVGGKQKPRGNRTPRSGVGARANQLDRVSMLYRDDGCREPAHTRGEKTKPKKAERRERSRHCRGAELNLRRVSLATGQGGRRRRRRCLPNAVPSPRCRQGRLKTPRRATCIVQRARGECHMQRAMCDVQRAACKVQRATCNVQRSTINVQRATCTVQRETCSVQCATCNVRRKTCNVKPATCNELGHVQHV